MNTDRRVALRVGLRTGLREISRPGERQISDAHLRRLTTSALTSVIVSSNVIGTLIVLALLLLKIVPLPVVRHTGRIRLENAIAAAAYVAVALPFGWFRGNRIIRRGTGWLGSGHGPTAEETRALLYAPRRLFAIQMWLWVAAAVLFSLLGAHLSGGRLAERVAVTVVLTGFTTAALAYLFAERLLRSLVARALQYGTPDHLGVPGVTTRTLLAWGLGTGLPVGGMASVAVVALTPGNGGITVAQLALCTVTLSGTAIIVGLLAVLVAVRTTADPISSLRRGLAQVQRGDFDTRIPVYDVSQLGRLQIGFNEMVAGLAERERIRAAFGTYVDPDVAEKIIAAGTSLAGEEVDVTCMFIDVRGFTSFAEQTPADEVVATLNRLFELIVPLIAECEGRIDKFVGDGLLAVFGAPRRLEDHADKALAAARRIAAAMADAEDLSLSIGVGLNSGPVVAGNVGGGGRFEFSVIGDTVNVAARVEAATRQTGDDILLSAQTRDRLRAPVEMVQRDGVELKGKHDPVKVYALAD